MEKKKCIIDKFKVLGFNSDHERVLFEQHLNFDYTYKSQADKPLLASNTN